MGKDSALYQLMDVRMHSVMNGIVSSDGEYQAILRRSDIYSGELDRMDLSKEIRLLIDRYVSEQNALGSRFGMLAYLLGFSDCKAMFLGKCLPTEAPPAPSQKPHTRPCIPPSRHSGNPISGALTAFLMPFSAYAPQGRGRRCLPRHRRCRLVHP